MVFLVFLLEFGAVPTMWYLLFSYWSLKLFLQCGIFLFFLLEFGAVPTVCYFCFSIKVWSCSYSVVFVVFLLEFGAVPTAWYLLFFYWSLELFLQCGIFCFFY